MVGASQTFLYDFSVPSTVTTAFERLKKNSKPLIAMPA